MRAGPRHCCVTDFYRANRHHCRRRGRPKNRNRRKGGQDQCQVGEEDILFIRFRRRDVDAPCGRTRDDGERHQCGGRQRRQCDSNSLARRDSESGICRQAAAERGCQVGKSEIGHEHDRPDQRLDELPDVLRARAHRSARHQARETVREQ